MKWVCLSDPDSVSVDFDTSQLLLTSKLDLFSGIISHQRLTTYGRRSPPRHFTQVSHGKGAEALWCQKHTSPCGTRSQDSEKHAWKVVILARRKRTDFPCASSCRCFTHTHRQTDEGWKRETTGSSGLAEHKGMFFQGRVFRVQVKAGNTIQEAGYLSRDLSGGGVALIHGGRSQKMRKWLIVNSSSQYKNTTCFYFLFVCLFVWNRY